MKYDIVKRPETHDGVWFDHHLKLYVENNNRPNLIETLNEKVGKQSEAWDFKTDTRWGRLHYLFGPTSSEVIMFANKRDLIMFKLIWDEDTYKDPFADILKMYNNLKIHTPVMTAQQLSRTNRAANPPSWYSGNPCNEIQILDYEPSFIDFKKYRLPAKKEDDESL